MRICPNCNTVNKESAHYCKACGSRLTMEEIRTANEVDILKRQYTDSEGKLTDLNSEVKKVEEKLKKISKINKNIDLIKSVSKKLESRDKLEEKYDHKLLETKAQVTEQVKDAKYYKLRSLTRFRDELDSLSTRLRYLEKNDADTDSRVAFINKKLQEELRNLGNSLQKRIVNVKTSLGSEMKTLGNYNRDLEKVKEQIKNFESSVKLLENVNTKIASFDKKLDQLDQDVTRLAKNEIKVEELSSRVRDYEDKLKNSTTPVYKEIDELKVKLKAFEAQKTSINLVELQQRVHSLEKNIDVLSSLRKDIHKVEKEFGRLQQDNEKIMNKMGKTFEKNLDKMIKDKSSAFSKTLGMNIENQVEQISKALDQKLPQIGKLREQMIKAQGEIEELKENVQELNSLDLKEMRDQIYRKIKNIDTAHSLESEPSSSFGITQTKPLPEKDVGVKELEQKVRELEAMLRKSVSNSPIIIE